MARSQGAGAIKTTDLEEEKKSSKQCSRRIKDPPTIHRAKRLAVCSSLSVSVSIAEREDSIVSQHAPSVRRRHESSKAQPLAGSLTEEPSHENCARAGDELILRNTSAISKGFWETTVAAQ